jgi:hypothetical protein
VDLSLDPEPPANSAKHNKAANMLALEQYKTFVLLASGDAGQAAHPSKTSGSRLCNFIAADIETMFPGVLRQTPILNESSLMEGENFCLVVILAKAQTLTIHYTPFVRSCTPL